MRIGIVGARRGRQGIGEHVAWRLARLGAAVPAIVGTRPETLAEAQRNLRERHGLETRGYLSLAEMLQAEALDGVAICSPERCHRGQLRLALDRRVHVLCEKPLVFEPGRGSAEDARPLVDGFHAAGKLLMVNEQWPYTLPWFRRLWPQANAASLPRRLDVLLCPSDIGAAMIPNALPHVLSLLLAAAPPGGEARDIEVRAARIENGAATELNVRFDYGDDAGNRTHVRAVLRQVAAQPRPAGYAIDGQAVRRTIDMADYSMALVAVEDLSAVDDAVLAPRACDGDPKRRIAIPDPLQLLLEDFVARIASVEPPQSDATLLDRLRLLDAVYRAACEQLAPGRVGRSASPASRGVPITN